MWFPLALTVGNPATDIFLPSTDGKVDDYIYPFVRLLHVLAHHPDYSDEPKEIAAMAKCVLRAIYRSRRN